MAAEAKKNAVKAAPARAKNETEGAAAKKLITLPLGQIRFAQASYSHRERFA